MKEFRIKRIYEPYSEQDGIRVLVDRLWPRGITKERACLSLWAKEFAPSAELRKWYGHQEERFPVFSALYKKELNENTQAVQLKCQCIKALQEGTTVTFLTASKQLSTSQLQPLVEWLYVS